MSTDCPTPRFSLVIPAYNEEKYLPRLLDTIDNARAAYRGGPEAIEVIVADNGSTDQTAAIAATRGCRLVSVEKRVIAAARNAGAAAARAPVLAFTDADGRIAPRTFDAYDDAAENASIVAATSGVTFERWSLGLALTYATFVPLAWLTGMDTGVVFCRNDDFVRIGGYNEDRLYAEDVQLLLNLRRLGRKDGRRLTRLGAVKVVASTRKWDKYGDWHVFHRFPRLVLMMLRTPDRATDFVHQYWYNDR